MKLTHQIVAGVLHLVSGVASTTYPVIDPDLTVSYATKPNISDVDISLSTYDRIVLNVDGEPFLFNGIQIRADSLRILWGLTPEEIGIFWMDLQPDYFYSASESTHIQGGASKSKNFATSTTHEIGYSHTNTTGQSLTYLQFDFSDYPLDDIDAAKMRIYVTGNAIGDAPFTANLYGIADNSWDATSIDWNADAPNHDGVRLSGEDGTDYWFASSSSSWDPILEASYYDLDASDFIINHCPDRVASSVLQAQVNDTSFSNGATLYGALGEKPPTLALSSSNSWDYSYIETVLSWAEDAGITLEFVWFGSDSAGATMDNRVPYWVYKKHILVRKTQDIDGTIVLLVVKNVGSQYGKTAIANMMAHGAQYNTNTGDKKTLIGVDVNNEGAVTTIQKGSGGGIVWQNPATWAALDQFDSTSDFVARTMWEHQVNLANAVKESVYPVWTRANVNSGTKTPNVPYNEEMRANGGTSVDFGGMDPYITNATRLWQFGHQAGVITWVNWSLGSNLPMIMENGGSYDNAEWLLFATLAGGGFYNVYDFMSKSSYSMYVPVHRGAGDFTPKPTGDFVEGVVSTNNLLKLLQLDLATKRPNGAGGTDLVYFNALNDGTNLTDSLWSIPVSYAPTKGGVGIGVVRSNVALLLASTRDANFTLDNVASYGIQSVQHGKYNAAGNWASAGKYPYTTDGDNINIQITQGTLIHIQLNEPISR